MQLRLVIAAALVLGLWVQPGRLIAQRVDRASNKPNVVLIMMDDLGYGDIGSYGGSDAKTPNLDRLARDGVRLTHAYANGAVCTPTRAALISGRYQQRVGLEWVVGGTLQAKSGLAATGTSLPALLKKNGYVTGLLGKWHLGGRPEFSPNAHGFDEFFGFLGGAHDYYRHDNGRDGSPDLYENTRPIQTATTYLTDEITQRAARFIDRHAPQSFFLEVAYNAVHWPFQPPDLAASDARRDISGRQMPDDAPPATRRDYLRMLERADEGIGTILAALERNRVAQNTLVIFTNDNGGEWLSRNAPLYHRKATLWEGGIRVPLILRWSGRLPKGKTSEQVAITMDLTASILAATGTALPTGYRPDGIDILPGLARQAPTVERELFWRYVLPQRHQKAVRSGRWKLLVDGGLYLLFDLNEDPGERRDLAAQHPELVAKLKALLTDWERDVDQKTPTQ